MCQFYFCSMLDSRHAVLAMKPKQTTAEMWARGSDTTQRVAVERLALLIHIPQIQNSKPWALQPAILTDTSVPPENSWMARIADWHIHFSSTFTNIPYSTLYNLRNWKGVVTFCSSRNNQYVH
jgi:hypothetical protein